jgi:hypothetical protein
VRRGDGPDQYAGVTEALRLIKDARSALSAQAHGSAASPGVEAIAAERHRQIYDEDFDGAGDEKYKKHELIEAAACYALHWTGQIACIGAPMAWPWADEWWKPTTPLRDLAKAGALIAAEIDRLARAKNASAKLEDSRGPNQKSPSIKSPHTRMDVTPQW